MTITHELNKIRSDRVPTVTYTAVRPQQGTHEITVNCKITPDDKLIVKHNVYNDEFVFYGITPNDGIAEAYDHKDPKSTVSTTVLSRKALTNLHRYIGQMLVDTGPAQ